MNTINEKRQRRAKVWEDAKKFLDSRRDERGMLSAEDTATYDARQERSTRRRKAGHRMSTGRRSGTR